MFRKSHFTIGMPELAMAGLSEEWLLKICGDIHWKILSSMFDEKTSNFRDADGNRIYSAFRSVEISGANLSAVGEDDLLTIVSSLAQISATQVYSKHILSVDGNQIAEVSMISVFLARIVEGLNKSVIKVQLAKASADKIHQGEEHLLTKKTRAINKNPNVPPNSKYMCLDNSNFAPRRFSPCPNVYFNGADLLYFAKYHTFADQYEWDTVAGNKSVLKTGHREIYYYGNIELGEKVFVKYRGLTITDTLVKHWVEVFRESDSFKISDIFTTKSKYK